MGAHAYVTSNAFAGLAATAFTWSNAATANRAYLNDDRMDQRMLVSASAASGISLVINMGSAQALVGIAVLNSNCAVQKTDATLRIRGADDAAITTNVVTAKAASTLYSSVLPRNKDHVLQFSAVTKQYWELLWTWTGNVTNFSIGEVFAIATKTSLSRRSIYGSAEGKRMFTARDQFQTGDSRGLKQGGPQRIIDLLFTDLNPSARDELDTMWSSAEANVGKLLWIDSAEANATAASATEQNCIWGNLEEAELMFDQGDFDLHNIRPLRVSSAGREAGA